MANFTIVSAPQRSPEWFAARVGRLTGSVAADMLAMKKKSDDEAVVHRDLRMRLAVERLTGLSADDGYSNRDMQRGVALEPDARRAYEVATGLVVRQTGFLRHTELLAGCSLDGHVGDFGGIIEIKCPKMATHFGYWSARTAVPSDHHAQVIHNLWMSGASWCDFVSFDPRFPPPLQLLRIRYERDEREMRAYELAARLFLREVETTVADVARLMEIAA